MATQAASSFTPQPTLPNPARSPEVLNLLLRLVSLSLSLGLNATALFISERYSCLCPLSEEAAFLHAISLTRLGEHRQALELLKGAIVEAPPYPNGSGPLSSNSGSSSTRRPACEASVRCAWVYADAALQLGRVNEGSECLKRAYMIYGHDNISLPDYVNPGRAQPSSGNASAVCVQLSLAKLAQAANKPDIAVQRYQEALREAWWCWEAYEGLCELGKASDADQQFPPIPVPLVHDPTDKQLDPPPASFLAAPPMDMRNFDRRSASSQGGPKAGLTSSLHMQQDRRSNSVSSQSSFFRTSTPSFQFDHGQSFFGSRKHGQAATSTPVESQGAAFRFGEASDGVEDDFQEQRRTRAGLPEPAADSRLSVSIEDGQGVGDESSFWNPNAAGRRTKGQTGLTKGKGGLFGFAASQNSAPLFGQGLLFGQNGSGNSEGRQNVIVSSSSGTSGGFFTPVNVQNDMETPEAGPACATSRLGIGRVAPAGKRTINQIDESTADDSFRFQFQAKERRQQGLPSVNGPGAIGNSADLEETLSDERFNEADYVQEDNLNGISRPAYARKQSHLMDRFGHRTNGNHAPLDVSTTGSNFASKVNRIVSNPREKKRTKAGPSSYDDASTATTTSSSHSIDTNSALYPAYSSSPPLGQSENEPRGYNLPHAPMRSSTIENAASPTTTPVFHKLVPPPATSLRVATSQPLAAAPSADREMYYRRQLEAAQTALAENWLRGIYRSFAKASAYLSRYECSNAIKTVLALPREQRESTRALLILGEAYFESLEYAKAEKAYVTLRSLAPFSPKGMGIYSTLLWHLHRPTHLSYLAQDLLELSPTKPYAWIATGNVFSHLEDHANALKCFKRAIQCDSSFIYAYTLAGHESVTMDEWDVAIGFFREALRRQPLHYNAWFGLGNVYMKTGKFRMAEYHFRKAVEINPSNAMLVCCVGTVLEKLDRKKEALEMYERACLLAPTSPAVRFKRVRMLMELRQFDSALRDLMLVRDMAPDEFNVHYLLGKLYGAMGDKVNMTRNLTIAQDLEPRAAGRIREIIEHAGQPSDVESDDDGEDGADAREEDISDNEGMRADDENESVPEGGGRDADMS